MSGRTLITVLAALLALVLTGCGGDEQVGGKSTPEPAKETLQWDLRQGHTTKNVRWPNDTTAFELHGGVQVNLMLPGGKTFADRVERAMGRRDGEVIRQLNLSYPAASTEAAYVRARQLGKDWGIDLRNIDAWYKRRIQQRSQGSEDTSDTAFTGDPHSQPLGGPTGPRPALEMMNSFKRDRPVVVSLSFIWRR